MAYYNELKKQAIKYIDGLAKKGIHRREDMVFAILKETGFGKKFVLDYIEANLDRGVYQEENGIITVKE